MMYAQYNMVDEIDVAHCNNRHTHNNDDENRAKNTAKTHYSILIDVKAL